MAQSSHALLLAGLVVMSHLSSGNTLELSDIQTTSRVCVDSRSLQGSVHCKLLNTIM